MRSSEVLRRASEVIRRRGWCQEDFAEKGGNLATCRVCAWGAINAAATGDPTDWEYSNGHEQPALDWLTRAVFGEQFGGYVAEWNDDLDRTVEDVLAALNKAAHLAESEGD